MQSASTQMIEKLNAAIRNYLGHTEVWRASGRGEGNLRYALAEGEHFLAEREVREVVPPPRPQVSLTDLIEAIAAQEGVTVLIAAGGPPRRP